MADGVVTVMYSTALPTATNDTWVNITDSKFMRNRVCGAGGPSVMSVTCLHACMDGLLARLRAEPVAAPCMALSPEVNTQLHIPHVLVLEEG